MNRVIFHVLQQHTSVNYRQLQPLQNTNHISIAFNSQHFPILPLIIHLYLDNPPFNKFSIAFVKHFCPQKASLYGSQDGLSYVKFYQMKNLLDKQQQYTIIFKQQFIYNYIKIVLEEAAPKTKINYCHQVKIKGIQFSLISFFNTRFLCSLASKLTYHPVLFRLLEVIQYKCLLLKANHNSLYQKYQKRMEQLTRMIQNKKIDIKNPSSKQIQKWRDESNYLQSQPIIIDNFIERPDPVKTKAQIKLLMKDIQYFAIDRVNNVNADVRQYFSKFQNGQIQQRYLKQMSSSQMEDHNKALVSFWNDIKQKQGPINLETEESVLTFFNYYLQHEPDHLIIYTLKILILFHKISSSQFAYSLQHIYLKILDNIIGFIHQNDNQQIYNLSLKYCYLLFERIDHQKFVQSLLKDYQHYDFIEQIQILGILQKLTFRNVRIDNRNEIVQFVIGILMNKQIQLGQKNRAYNILAYLACIFGKETIMRDCQKMNSMIIMTMERLIDSKMGKILKQKSEQINKCQYCGLQSPNFKDPNLYDLHLAKQCRFICNCKYCGQNVQIPDLFKHYIEQCDNKNEFKHCQNCFQVIRIDDEKHDKTCLRKLITKCPLCYAKVDNKLKLKEHIIIDGCPNNTR